MFLLLVPFALVLIVVSVLGFAGFGPLTDDRRSEREGVLGALGPAVGLLAGIGILGLAVIGMGSVIGLADHDDREADEKLHSSGPAASTPTTDTPPRTAPRLRSTRPASVVGPNVTIGVDDGEGFPSVLRRRRPARGATPSSGSPRTASSRSNAASWSSARRRSRPRCFNQIPVQFDEDGIARFQYLATLSFLQGSPPAGRCRVGTAPCVIVVRSVEADRRGELQTIFGATAPSPGRITVTKADGLSLDGETVTVTVRNYPPGVTVRAMLCAAPEATLDRCGRPGPQAPLVVGADGTGRTELRIEPGPVGAVRASCTRGSDCGIAVASRDVFARAPVVPISFAGRGGASYDPARLALGLALAAILVGIAAWLLVRTDWSAVGEAAAPEIDDAEYADLDAIIAALPPEEDELVSAR